jgi:hypothetical protein
MMKRRRLLNVLIAAAICCAACTACSRSHESTSSGEADGIDPNRWRPAAEAIAAAEREKKAPMTLARATQPRASAYDLNPRAAAAGQSSDPASEEQLAQDDPSIAGMPKLPPPPMPKLGRGDEADQFGLPEWEQIARGDLHIKRIRY